MMLEQLGTGEQLGTELEKIATAMGYIGEEDADNLTAMAESLGYESAEAFISAMEENISIAKQRYEDAFQGFTDIGVDASAFKEMGLSSGAVEGLSQQISRAFLVGGEDGAQTLTTGIANILSQVPAELQNEVLAAINGLDWENAKAIDKLGTQLKGLGIEAKSLDGFDTLTTDLIDINNAARAVDLEQLADQIRHLSGIVFNIGSGEQTRQFSSGDYDDLIEAMPELKGDFTYNLETDTFDYIGTSMNDLAAAIVANTNAILGQTGLEQKTASGQVIERMMSDDGASYAKASTGSADAMVDWLTSYISQAGANAGISQEAVDRWGQAENTEQLQAMMDMVYQNYVNLSDNTAKLNAVAVEGLAAAAQVQGPVATSQLASQARESGDPDAVNAYTQALRAQAIAAGVTEDVLEDYAKALEDGSDAQIKAAETALANATATRQQEKALTKTLDNWEESVKKMEEYEEGSLGYNQALEQIAGTLGMQVDDPFLQVAENQELIKKAAEKNTQALIDLQGQLAEHYGFTIDGLGNFDPGPMIAGLDDGQEKAIALTNQLLQAGQFVIAEEDMIAGQTYQVPRIIDGPLGFPIVTGFDTVTGYTGGKIPVVKPASAPTIDKVQTDRGGGIGKKSSGGGGGGGSKKKRNLG